MDGEVTSRKIGEGRGPNELPMKGARGVFVDKNNSFLAYGSTWDAYVFDNFENVRMIQEKPSEESDSYDDSRLYCSGAPELIAKRYKDKFYYNLDLDHPDYNPVTRSKDIFKNAHIIMEVDMHSGEMRPLGNYPQHYVDHNYELNHLNGALYDMDDDGNFYVAFQADSLIYEYDNEFRPLRSYGFPGTDMDTDYKSVRGSIEEWLEKLKIDRQHQGRYYWIKHIPELNMTLRSYQRSSREPFDGLQIYEDGVLVGDVDVPKQFRVTGYIEPYFVTAVTDRNLNEKLQFYRFTLKK